MRGAMIIVNKPVDDYHAHLYIKKPEFFGRLLTKKLKVHFAESTLNAGKYALKLIFLNRLLIMMSLVDLRLGEVQMNKVRRIQNNWKESLMSSGIIAHDLSDVEKPMDLIKDHPERIAFTKEVIRYAKLLALAQDKQISRANETIATIEEELNRM